MSNAIDRRRFVAAHRDGFATAGGSGGTVAARLRIAHLTPAPQDRGTD